MPLPEAQRVIALTVHRENGVLVIEESNYYSGELVITDGLPSTNKGDVSRHGFGIKSIQHIAKQYGGTVDIKVVDDMFFLTVRFPGQALKK